MNYNDHKSINPNSLLTKLAVLISGVFISTGSAAHARTISTTFDTHAEGWTGTQPAEVAWTSTGGNPGGYLRFVDGSSNGTDVIAPMSFLGDWSALNGSGTIAFDHKLFSRGSSVFAPYEILLSGPGGSAEWIGPTPREITNWATLSAPLQASQWNILSGTWAGLLANVTLFKIRIELINGSDTDGIDNVRLTSSGSSEGVIPLSSSNPAFSLPVVGTLSSQLNTLNATPPAFDPATWLPVNRRTHASPPPQSPFRCDCTGVPPALGCDAILSANPLAEVFVAADQHLTNVDEVTLDNCGSAFYRFTFTMPPDFLNPSLSWFANVDDEAVLFLNGNRISAALTNPGCDPDPLNGSADPCYALQDAGSDRVDMLGLPALTMPTIDSFQANDPTFFVPGENELVFAVAGDASFFEPTGVEFVATVTFTPTLLDCNSNGVDDTSDISNGTSLDCNTNGTPDECEIDANSMAPGGPFFCTILCAQDCNGNGIPDQCDLTSGTATIFATGMSLPEDIVSSRGPYPPGFFVPDFLLNEVLHISSDGTLVTPFATANLKAPIGAAFAPNEFGGQGDRLFVANQNNGVEPFAPDVVVIDAVGVALPFAEILTRRGITGLTYVPLSVGGLNAGKLLATSSFADAAGNRNSYIYSIDASGNSSLLTSLSMLIFTPALAPAGFGNFGNDMFVFIATTESAQLSVFDLQTNQITPFATVPLGPGQIVGQGESGLRQIAFSPIGWFASFDPSLATESVLVVTLAGSRNGGGMNGSLIAFRSDGTLVGVLTQAGVGLQFDPRGLLFDGNNLLISNTAAGTLLTVTVDDFQNSIDCNGNGAADECDIASGASIDCNVNRIPDECELAGNDCNANGVPDDCDLANNDCNANSIPDDCDIAAGTSTDCNTNGIPDECEAGVPLDISRFIGVLLGTNVDPVDVCLADVNGDGVTNGLDIQLFVNAMLGL